MRTVRTNFAQYPSEIPDQLSAVVIGQIYPYTYCDSDGDGIGDIRGITNRLGHIATLVDRIWLSPIYPSPEVNGDNGYDPIDRTTVSKKFGTRQDLAEMVESARRYGLDVILDFVPCHSSDKHPDFVKSAAKEPGYEDLYVWHPGRLDSAGNHIPPNNWLNVHADGSCPELDRAWVWHAGRQEWFLDHFSNKKARGTQPAVNLNDKTNQTKIIDEMKIWMPLGIAGFRLDAVSFALHKSLRNLSPDEVAERTNNPWKQGWPCQERWNNQWFKHSICQPGTGTFLKRMRHDLNAYARALGQQPPFLFAEVIAGRNGGSDSIYVAKEYSQHVDSCYTEATYFWEYPNADWIRRALQNVEELLPGKNGNPMGNHDWPRFASRMGDKTKTVRDHLRKLMFCFPGDLSYMLGAEELGLTQGQVPHDKIRDVAGRDGQRGPGPLKAIRRNGGVSSAHPDRLYLPVSPEHLPLAYDRQLGKPGSTLMNMQEWYQWRKVQPALLKGQTIIIDNDGPLVAFLRVAREQTMLCMLNTHDTEVIDFKPADYMDATFLKKLRLSPNETIRVGPGESDFYGCRPYEVHHIPQNIVRPERPASTASPRGKRAGLPVERLRYAG
jgi:alpha-glucosidase